MSMSEELQKREAAKPDTWTIAWIEQRFQEVFKAYRGACHASNCVIAETQDVLKENRVLRERLELLEADRAKIGELQARVDRIAEFLNKQKNGKPDVQAS